MSIPKDKDQLLLAIKEDYQKLKTELSVIPESLVRIQELEGHSKNTFMSIHNLVAYLLGWSRLVLKWEYRKSKDLEVDFPETGFQWNELGRLAQQFYRDYEHQNFSVLCKNLEETVEVILKLIRSKSDEELYQRPWYGSYTLGRMIQLNTTSPMKNAKVRIRRWKKKRLLK